MKTVTDFLRGGVLKREWVDHFLDPEKPSWARFDPELGYRGNNSIVRDGIDGAYSVYTYADAGHRRVVNHPERPCRLNTYGNSFTQCHQVSDGETWQEHLAAHFGEPIRNWGMGGYGVFQAYRRMKREEQTALAAPNVILNIWGDDHHRSLMSWRWLSYQEAWRTADDPVMFHSNPWAHIRYDLDAGAWVEHDNPYPTPESLYLLCDEDHVIEHFKDDVIVHLMAAGRGAGELDTAMLNAHAAWLGVDADFTNEATRGAAAKAVFDAYAWRATLEILDRVHTFVGEHGKKLMLLFSYPDVAVREACKLGSRDHADYFDWHPAPVRAWAGEHGVTMVDSLPAHLADFEKFELSPQDYIDRYYYFHYNPKGNQFFAFAVKDALVEWLDPKPFTYRGEDRAIEFENYLP